MPDPLSDLEVLALAALARLGPDAYGVSIREHIRERAGRAVSLGSLYKALQRLEDRDLAESSVGEPTPERGGRAKKHVAITAQGRVALADAVASFRRMTEGLGLDAEAS
jgi:DNA-binding PadR family transcriptional regulator